MKALLYLNNRMHIRTAMVVCFAWFSHSYVFSQCPTLTVTNDTTVCAGSTLQLNASNGFSNYSWNPTTGLTGSFQQNPIATITNSTQYTVTASTLGPNLISNPDFSLGNVGFTSGLNHAPVYSPGNYFVSNTYFIPAYNYLTDHTATADNFMMAVDGSTFVTTLYETTLPIIPNTNYVFNFWASKADQVQPIFEIQLLGNVGGNAISINPGFPYSGTWAWDLYGIPSWNSGANTSVTIRIRNLEINGFGNDFALDDFSFRTLCTETDTVVITAGLPNAMLTGPSQMCAGDTVSLTASGGNSYVWNNGFSSAVLNVSPAVTTNYSVNVSDTTGCQNTLNHLINVFPIPAASINGNLPVCPGDTVTLTASGGTSYLWNTGATAGTIHVNPLTTSPFEVIAFNTICSDTTSVTVNVLPVPLPPNVNDTVICQFTNVVLNTNGSNVMWYFTPGQTGYAGSFYVPTHTTGNFTYYVTQTVNGCESNAGAFNVIINEAPDFSLGDDQPLCVGQTAVIGVPQNNLSSYYWLDGITTSYREVEQEGMYVLTATNNCGSFTDTVEITFGDCECYFYIPNSFTPNGNGLNEFFIPVFDCRIKDYSFMIFNRWGQIIFETNDPLIGWNGFTNNKPAEQGVYVYKVVLTSTNEVLENTRQYYGHVTLLK